MPSYFCDNYKIHVEEVLLGKCKLDFNSGFVGSHQCIIGSGLLENYTFCNLKLLKLILFLLRKGINIALLLGVIVN